jgi:GT2 family glycosyltransferase
VDCQALARDHRARVIANDRALGPAVARNMAAAAATGDVLVFIDSDVVVSRASLKRLVAIFDESGSIDAVFGAYDDRPRDAGFMSQYKNLSHAFVHRASARLASTFWAGFGAVRRDAFFAVGGFDERFARPSVEDIDLGYRLTAAGFEIALDPTLSCCHLKRWTLGGAILSDIRDRGIPWTQLVLRYGVAGDHLNLSAVHRASVVLAYLVLLTGAIAILVDARAAWAAVLSLAGLGILNRTYYRFFYRERGLVFALRVFPVHLLHHLCNGVSFVVGSVLFAASQIFGVRLGPALPIEPWPNS